MRGDNTILIGAAFASNLCVADEFQAFSTKAASFITPTAVATVVFKQASKPNMTSRMRSDRYSPAWAAPPQ